MNTIADGQWLQRSDEAMPDLPAGAVGVYETLLLRGGAPEFWDEHSARFAKGSRAFGLAMPGTDAELREQVDRLAQSARVDLGVARYALWCDAGRVHWRVDVSLPRPHMRKREFRVLWGPVVPGRGDESGFKHLGRTAWHAALREARQAGFEETLLCDASGELIEGGGCNILLIRDGVLHTPRLESGALPGVMRAQVLALAEALGWEIRERRVVRDDVDAADELWVSNSIIGLRRVVAIGERELSGGGERFEAFRGAWHGRYGWDPVVVAG